MNLPRELLRISLGVSDRLPCRADETQWKQAYAFARRQMLIGTFWQVIEKLPEGFGPSDGLRLKWQTDAQTIAIVNVMHARVCGEIKEYFEARGLESCILKGCGLADYYPEPESRQTGDIDIWVNGARDKIIETAGRDYRVEEVLWQECKLRMMDDIAVDLHFYPTKSYNPVLMARLAKFYAGEASRQMRGLYPDVRFNLVFCLSHLYRHALRGGASLKQLCDYRWLLAKASKEDRKEAYATIRHLGMAGIAADLMFALSRLAGAEDGVLICKPSAEWRGRRFVADMLAYSAGDSGRRTLKGEISLLLRYPSEMLWAPAARLGQYCWRKKKDYI